MPLPPSDVIREATHTRAITIRGYKRADGLWDVEGHLTDSRINDVMLKSGLRPAGQFIHSMWLRLTVDKLAEIKAVKATTDASPFADTCGNITQAYGALVGLRIGAGFRKDVQRLFSGVLGCTHMTELILTMATGVIQTLAGEVSQDESEPPFGLNGCHAQAIDSPVVAIYYPRWFRNTGELNK